MLGLVSKVAGATFACALLISTTAYAKKLTVAPGDPPVTIDVPATWETDEIKRGVQINTPDEEVYIWVETYVPAQLDTILAEHNKYYKEQGVTITGEAEQASKDFPKSAMKISTYPAKDEDGPTIIRYLSIGPKDEKQRRILLSYWASPDGDKTYDPVVDKIVESLIASVEGP